MPKAMFSVSCLAGGCLAALLLTGACDDDEPAAPAVDSGTGTDAGAGDADSDAATEAKAGIIHVIAEMAPQAPAPDAGAPPFVSAAYVADYPGAAAAGLWGAKQPSVAVPGPAEGLGCSAYVYGMTNLPPSAPNEGDLTLSGFTGGATINPADGGTTPFAPPSVCKRVQNPLTALFTHECPFNGAAMSDFIDKANTLTLSAAGGADVDSWSLNVQPPAIGVVKVSQNLFGLAKADVDGSKDLTLNYDCDGAACGQAPIVIISIETTDNTSAPNPFAWGSPIAEGGVAICITSGSVSPSSFTVPKSILGVLPKTYAGLRTAVIAVTPSQTATAQKRVPVQFFGGFGAFGITR